MARAERALAGAASAPPLPQSREGGEAAVSGTQYLPWEPAAVELERALARGDAAAVRRALPGFVRAFRGEPLLFVPLAEGGHPRPILRARLALALVRTLLDRLPRLGLVRETYHLVKLAKAMESNATAEGRRVTEFDRLFQIALPAVVAALLDADTGGAPALEPLRQVVDSFLELWLRHSETLRLSVLEGYAGQAEWDALAGFVRKYGGGLFNPQFLTLSNLRGILHRGVEAYLDTLLNETEPRDPSRLLNDLRAGKLPRPEAAQHLKAVLQALVENYEEYRDYNSTTAQSDYGENLHQLLDLLRVKASYERYAWRMRPLLMAHDVFCRHGHADAALRWQEKVAELTRSLSADLLEVLARREQEHGIHLRTVRDRLEERFVQPLVADRLAAGVGPALREADQTADGPVFRSFEGSLRELTATPAGVGLDAPAWLRRLESEVKRVRVEQDNPRRRRPTVALTAADLQRQLTEWEKPIE
jgi:hypothetical protein